MLEFQFLYYLLPVRVPDCILIVFYQAKWVLSVKAASKFNQSATTAYLKNATESASDHCQFTLGAYPTCQHASGKPGHGISLIPCFYVAKNKHRNFY